MDHEHGNEGNSKNITPNNEDDMLVPPKTLGSSSEPSTESKVADETTPASEESGPESKAAISSSELSGHSMQGSSSMFPPAYSSQTMGHPVGYDPNRIPSNVFASKPATPMDWSVASNESLFSIQMGNNSFSRNQFFMLYKSGELPKFDDTVNVLNGLPPTPELDEMNKRSENTEKGSQLAEASSCANAEITTVEMHKSADTKKSENDQAATNKLEVLDEADHSQLKSISSRSEGSINSPCSFAFPVLEDEGGGRLSSVKVNTVEKQQSRNHQHQNQQQQQQQQPSQTSETTPKISAGNSWFSCFSFCKIGCC